MYSLRLVTAMGSLDYKHKEAFNRFKNRTREVKICPNCNCETLTHDFTTFHDYKDDLMVAIKFLCKNCSWSKTNEIPYQAVLNDPSI